MERIYEFEKQLQWLEERTQDELQTYLSDLFFESTAYPLLLPTNPATSLASVMTGYYTPSKNDAYKGKFRQALVNLIKPEKKQYLGLEDVIYLTYMLEIKEAIPALQNLINSTPSPDAVDSNRTYSVAKSSLSYLEQLV